MKFHERTVTVVMATGENDQIAILLLYMDDSRIKRVCRPTLPDR